MWTSWDAKLCTCGHIYLFLKGRGVSVTFGFCPLPKKVKNHCLGSCISWFECSVSYSVLFFFLLQLLFTNMEYFKLTVTWRNNVTNLYTNHSASVVIYSWLVIFRLYQCPLLLWVPSHPDCFKGNPRHRFIIKYFSMYSKWKT